MSVLIAIPPGDFRSLLIHFAASRAQVAIQYAKGGVDGLVVGRVVVVDADSVAVHVARMADVWRIRLSSVQAIDVLDEPKRETEAHAQGE